MNDAVPSDDTLLDAEQPHHDATETTCCIAGGGPGGILLALLLARAGVSVTVLESRADFDRDFRGDSVHSYTLELLDELGLCEEFLRIPHIRMEHIEFQTQDGVLTVADFRRLKSKFPYQVVMPQMELLNFLAKKLQRYPHAVVHMRSPVQELIVEQGIVRGIVYRDAAGQPHEVRAALVVGADGRHSTVRRLAGIEPVEFTAPMDILWFRLPRAEHDDPAHPGVKVVFGKGYFCIITNRPGKEWQLGYAIVKSSYSQLRAQGIEALRRNVALLLPIFADRMNTLHDFSQVAVLAANSSYCRRWWKPGLLLIGDAAHVMSPVAGVGILQAVHDAVAAANVLTTPLQSGQLTDGDLAKVQGQRWGPVRRMQLAQAFVHRFVIKPVLRSSGEPRFPWWLRLFFRINGRRRNSSSWIAYGFSPPRWNKAEEFHP